ncbi:hypothetical protein V6N13_020451 [Hibiscus sabdariffa]
MSDFLTLSLPDWIFSNIGSDQDFANSGDDWESLFPIVCWKLWHRRNSILFDPEFVEKDDLVVASLRYLDLCIAAKSVVPFHMDTSLVPAALPSFPREELHFCAPMWCQALLTTDLQHAVGVG